MDMCIQIVWEIVDAYENFQISGGCSLNVLAPNFVSNIKIYYVLNKAVFILFSRPFHLKLKH